MLTGRVATAERIQYPPEFRGEKDPIDRTKGTIKNCIPTTIRYKNDDVRCDVRRYTPEQSLPSDIAGNTVNTVSNTAEKELFVVLFGTQKSTRVQELKR